MAVAAQGGGSFLELSCVDYPVRARDPPNPRLRGEGVAARRRNVLVVVLGIGVQKDLCSGLFCKNHGLILSVFSRKKKIVREKMKNFYVKQKYTTEILYKYILICRITNCIEMTFEMRSLLENKHRSWQLKKKIGYCVLHS
jgi:hypothetical protein